MGISRSKAAPSHIHIHIHIHIHAAETTTHRVCPPFTVVHVTSRHVFTSTVPLVDEMHFFVRPIQLSCSELSWLQRRGSWVAAGFTTPVIVSKPPFIEVVFKK